MLCGFFIPLYTGYCVVIGVHSGRNLVLLLSLNVCSLVVWCGCMSDKGVVCLGRSMRYVSGCTSCIRVAVRGLINMYTPSPPLAHASLSSPYPSPLVMAWAPPQQARLGEEVQLTSPGE